MESPPGLERFSEKDKRPVRTTVYDWRLGIADEVDSVCPLRRGRRGRNGRRPRLTLQQFLRHLHDIGGGEAEVLGNDLERR